MSLVVVTGGWGPKRLDYLGGFWPSFHANWPMDVELRLVTDQPDQVMKGLLGHNRSDESALVSRGVTAPPWRRVSVDALPQAWTSFVTRHASDPVHNGRAVGPGHTWKPRALQAGYNFRYDAVRFAGQGFAVQLAAPIYPDDTVVCWLDADVETFKRVPAGFVEDLVGQADGAYLGRSPKHSEIGFWAVRLSPVTRMLVQEFANLYASDELFDFREWHSAYAWDTARRAVASLGALDMRNLTPGGTGHVWFQSQLGQYLDHMKGDRKKAGRSRERR